MLEGLRKVLGLGAEAAAVSGVVSPARLSQWAAGYGWRFTPSDTAQGFTVDGALDGLVWRLENAVPSRDYVQGAELRLHMELPVNPQASVMLINRTLKESLETRVFGAITNSLQTTVSTDLPQELRWLSIHANWAWPQLPASFRQGFAVLGNNKEFAQLCVNAAVVAQAMQEKQAAAPGTVPLVLMLNEGRLSLRMQTVAYHLPDLEYALALFLTTAKVARHNLGQSMDSSLSTLPPPEA